MKVAIDEAGPADAEVLRSLWQLHLHDRSDVDGADLDDRGHFVDPGLNRVGPGSGRLAYLIRVEGRPAGFALVDRQGVLAEGGGGHAIARFFVVRKHRRRGVGGRAAAEVLRRHPGRWEVRQAAGDVAARSFWRGVIDRCAAGQFEESALDDRRWWGWVQTFAIEAGGGSREDRAPAGQ